MNYQEGDYKKVRELKDGEFGWTTPWQFAYSGRGLFTRFDLTLRRERGGTICMKVVRENGVHYVEHHPTFFSDEEIKNMRGRDFSDPGILVIPRPIREASSYKAIVFTDGVIVVTPNGARVRVTDEPRDS